jgi:hypothetical protein
VVEVGLRADGAKADVGVASARMAIGSFMVGTGDLIGGGDGAWKIIYEPPSPEATLLVSAEVTTRGSFGRRAKIRSCENP